jgi:hypothetical protein
MTPALRLEHAKKSFLDHHIYVFIGCTYHTAAAAVHRLGGLAPQAAPLLHSVIRLPATQPKGLHWQHTGQEVEKREQHLSYLP